ncbi:MAG: phosphoesterase, partial [Aphanocapsa feldmannii 277cI]
MIAKAIELRISVLAITDHNSVSGIAAFRDAATATGITVFPGFELASSEGIHVLCIYPPDIKDERLERFLGKFDIHGTEPSSDLSSQSFEQIIKMVQEEQSGIIIAAHITQKNGLFTALNGQARIKAWRSRDLLAIQVPGLVQDLPQNIRKIVENKNPDYQRDHFHDKNQGLAVVNAMDITKPEDLDDPSATCSIKMSEVSIEGLRQAFLDPGSRIRLNPKEGPLESAEHSELMELAWEGGFLDGTTLKLNPNLNVLVGGRGAGKSTVIESLRYVLDLNPIGEEAQKAHAGVVHKVLCSGTKISLRARCHHPTKRQYQIERTVPNPAVVRDDRGQVSNLLPAEILPHLEIYGQHEISELARSSEKLTRLLGRFAPQDPSLGKEKNDVRRGLEETRRSILDVQTELTEIEERLAKLPGLEETLERFREAGLEDRLRERSLLVREERVLDSIPERLEPIRDCLESLQREIPIDRVFLSSKALQDLPGKEILGEADGILERLSCDIEVLMRRFGQILSAADEGISAVRSCWKERQQKVQRDYEKILRELNEQFIRLRREIEGLRPLQERKSILQRLEKEYTERRRILLDEWEGIKAQEFQILVKATKTIGRKLRDDVQVEVTAAGDREPLFKLLREEVGGRLSEAINSLGEKKNFTLPFFVKSCRMGPEAVQEAYGVPAKQAHSLAQAPADVLMRVEELELQTATTIRLNTAPSGEQPTWQALKDLSTGQKATAVLLLLLLESDAPLIVDQPEDDLDNRFISEAVVPRMREEKCRRQFIFSTHNANIPVLGDAELILGLTAAGEADAVGKAQIAPEHISSIDRQTVCEMIENLLEGGR